MHFQIIRLLYGVENERSEFTFGAQLKITVEKFDAVVRCRTIQPQQSIPLCFQ